MIKAPRIAKCHEQKSRARRTMKLRAVEVPLRPEPRQLKISIRIVSECAGLNQA